MVTGGMGVGPGPEESNLGGIVKRALVLFTSLATALALAAPAVGQEEEPDLRVPSAIADELGDAKAEAVYLVQLDGDPAVTYDGDIRGLPATAPAQGRKFNPNSRAAQRYKAHLTNSHDSVLRAIGGGEKLYDYWVSFNGFAAKMTGHEAALLEAREDVVNVWQDAARFPVTDNSPDFLGLTEADGLHATGLKGEDVIVGVIDTGIWPEHPSFSDQTDLSDAPGRSGRGTLAYDSPPSDWHGTCMSGEQFSQNDCNNKLIGARFYRLGAGAATVISDEYLSPRDRDGHGTHTASTAAGNEGVSASIFEIDRGTVSGIAPRARVAAYKVCWNDAGCFLSDIVASIDDAVSDGVDVINYSIGGGPSLLGPDGVAYLFAANAGVHVATSAGNSGPGAGTVGGPGSVPWITAVGASTQDRTFQGSVELGSGAEFFGASITGGTDVLPIVDSEDAGSELCIPGELDAEVVSGNIVLCFRGQIARVDKSRAVAEAGGAGMVLYNENNAQSEVTDNHFVPSVHINHTDGLAIKAYIAAEGAAATARIHGGERVTIPAPWMADFSSRGPNVVAEDIIKPDVTAPGVNVLAGNTPNPFLGAPGQLFQSISGTSMSSPHVAGVYALLKEAHPDWSPAMSKSAIMTTGHQDVVKENGSTPADPFDIGGGHIVPNSAIDPGLVYNAGFTDYVSFLCGNGTLACPGIDPSDLNLPSIGVGELAGFQTITRTVTSVTPGTATYNVSVEAPPGVTVEVDPMSLTLDEGDSASYEVTFTTQSGADLDEWAFGSLTWSHGPHSVRSPIAVKPVALAAPDEVMGTGTEGSLEFDVTFGYTGDYSAQPHGLIPADTITDTVVDDPENDINAALASGVGVNFHLVTINPGTEYARFSLFDDYTDGDDDLDLYVFGPQSAGFPFVGASGTPTSEEEVNLVAPDSGLYIVVVHGWQTDGPDATYTLFSWLLDETDAGNMTVTAPSAAVLGDTEMVTVDWAGLSADVKYLGSITHHDVASPTSYNDGRIAFTIVRVDTD
jgi:subtilisin family serine protease